MSVYLLPGVPDAVISKEMTVFVNPLETEAQYQSGLHGVAASLPRLAAALGRDWQSISSALGDMAMCLDMEAADIPLRDPDFDSASDLYEKLYVAVHAGREQQVRHILRRMLAAMGLTKRAHAELLHKHRQPAAGLPR